MNSKDVPLIEPVITLEEAKHYLEKYQNYHKRYKNFQGSPNDDCLIGLYGYTVREERGYIRNKISKYKRAIDKMKKENRTEITYKELFYL